MASLKASSPFSPATPGRRGAHGSPDADTFPSLSGGPDETLHSTQSLSGRPSLLTYRNRQYPSASAALTAYISDFDQEASPLKGSYRRTVEDLLSPRSVLLRTVDRSLDTGVRDTRAEWRRYVSKRLLDESYGEMVQADLQRERARSLMMETSRHLTADLSPLPGSSVITETESQASVSTNALLLASPYPSLEQPPPEPQPQNLPHPHPHPHPQPQPQPHPQPQPQARSQLQPRHQSQALPPRSGEARWIPPAGRSVPTRSRDRSGSLNGAQSLESRIQNLKARARAAPGRSLPTAETKPRALPPRVPKFQPDVSPIKKHSRVSGRATERSFLPEDLGLPRTSLGRDSLRAGGRAGRSRTGRESLLPPSSEGPRVPPGRSSDGRRAPPSWVQDLEGAESGVSEGALPRANPGGRAPPSWIQDLEASGIEAAGLRDPDPGASEAPGRHAGGRPPPSWIQDFNSTLTSGWQDAGLPWKPWAAPIGSPRARKTSNRASLDRRSSDPLRRDAYDDDDRTPAEKPPGLTYRDFDFSQDFSANADGSRSLRDSGRIAGVLASSPGDCSPRKAGRALSFTTDDLVLASPTGKGFGSPKGHSRSQSARQLRFSPMHPTSISPEPHLSTRTDSPGSGTAWRGGSNSLRQSQKHRDNKGLRSQNGALQDEDRQREEAVLERVQRVLEAARSSQSLSHSHSHSQPAHLPEDQEGLLRRQWDADRRDDADRHDNSVLTEEILEGDRPWERRPPLPAHKPQPLLQQRDIVSQFLEDCLKSADENQKLTGGSQPGPVEALKNMLFTLQGMDPAISSSGPTDKMAQSAPETALGFPAMDVSPNPPPGPKDDERQRRSPVKERLDSETTSPDSSRSNFDEAPGGRSLQRAMEHLSRLKLLVNGAPRQNSRPSSADAHVASS